MGEKKRKEAAKKSFVFEKLNFIWMFIGLTLITSGFILMAGGGSNDPLLFSEAIFSTQRIRVAPTLVLIGFAIEIYAILLKTKQ